MSNHHQGIAEALEKAFCGKNIRVPQSHFDKKPEFDNEVDEQFIDLNNGKQLVLTLKMFMKFNLNDKQSDYFPYSTEFRVSIVEQDPNDSNQSESLSDSFAPAFINTPEVREAMINALKEYRSPLIAGLSANAEWLNVASTMSIHPKFSELMGQSFPNAIKVAKAGFSRPAL